MNLNVSKREYIFFLLRRLKINLSSEIQKDIAKFALSPR